MKTSSRRVWPPAGSWIRRYFPRSGAPLATSSLTGGVVRKICWSKPTMIPPMLCPTDPPFFFVTRSVYRRTGREPPGGGLEPSRFGRGYVAEP